MGKIFGNGNGVCRLLGAMNFRQPSAKISAVYRIKLRQWTFLRGVKGIQQVNFEQIMMPEDIFKNYRVY